MARKKAELVHKGIKILLSQQVMLDVLIESHGFLSESEIFRQALTEFYAKREPAYLRRTARTRAKERTALENERILKLTDEEYARQVVRGELATGTDGRFVLFHGWANDIKVLPLAEARGFFEKNPDFLDNHLDVLAVHPVMAMMDGRTAEDLRIEHGIVVTEKGDGTWATE